MSDYKPCPTCKMMVKGDCQLCNPKKVQEYRNADQIIRSVALECAVQMFHWFVDKEGKQYVNDASVIIREAKKFEQYIKEG